MFVYKMILGGLGMLGSYGLLATTSKAVPDWVEGGAAMAFVGFLLFSVKTLWGQNREYAAQVRELNETMKVTLQEELTKSDDSNARLISTIGDLNKELKIRREERE